MGGRHDVQDLHLLIDVPSRAVATRAGLVTVAQELGTADTAEEILEVAARSAQALEGVHAREAELAATRSVVSLAEALQRSSLSSPLQPDCFQIAVRYEPANEAAQIGGDWYDAFTAATGDATCVVIGDVNGHDQTAAALMTQIRSMLRATATATAYALPATAGPARVFAQLERAMTGLQVQALTSAIITVVGHEPSVASDASSGTTTQGRGETPRRRDVVWCNAGHLPPHDRRVDGTVEILSRTSDLLLGIGEPFPRSEHRTWLEETDTMLLYTDGLIERRDEDIDTGLERLSRLLAELGDIPVEQLADALLTQLLPEGGEDDVAFVLLRLRSVER